MSAKIDLTGSFHSNGFSAGIPPSLLSRWSTMWVLWFPFVTQHNRLKAAVSYLLYASRKSCSITDFYQVEKVWSLVEFKKHKWVTIVTCCLHIVVLKVKMEVRQYRDMREMRRIWFFCIDLLATVMHPDQWWLAQTFQLYVKATIINQRS